MMSCLMLFALLATVSAYTIKSGGPKTERPIIGVMAQESDPDDLQYGDTYIPAAYFKYIEMGGGRAIPVFVKRDADYYDRIFNSINGVLFPGGGVNLITSDYAKAAKIFFDKAVQAHDQGDYFPVWGTCMGFQLLTAMTTRKNLLTSFDAMDLALPLNFTKNYKTSRLFGDLPDDVYELLLKSDVTENFHHYGLDPATFYKTSALNDFYRILSTNLDRKGKEFVSGIEAIHYPIYGTQWHPEKPNFLWNTKYNINHGPGAIRVAQYFAAFLVNEARQSGHKFPTEKEEIDALIENYQPVYSRDDTFESIYFFNYTNGAAEKVTVTLN